MNKTETTKAYTLRPLKDKDLWPVLDILSKVFPEDLSKILAKVAMDQKSMEKGVEQIVKEIGADIVMKLVLAVLKNINTVHDEVYTLLSDLSGIPAEEIEEMEFGTTPSMIWDIVRDVKNLSFFAAVAKLS